MGALITLLMYGVIIVVMSFIAYVVIIKAIKDALKEYKNANGE